MLDIFDGVNSRDLRGASGVAIVEICRLHSVRIDISSSLEWGSDKLPCIVIVTNMKI
jgi:hypothetical protein